MADDLLRIPLPGTHPATPAITAPGDGSGYWAGGPSVAVDDEGTVWLAYRLRRPVGDGRGYAVAVARSDDGLAFTEVARVERAAFGCDSLERPALVRRPDGGWRLYLSLATSGTLHWTVVALDADHPKAFDPVTAVTVLDDGPDRALKDPVVHASPEGWEMWVCLHEVRDPAQADAMTTLYGRSPDGLAWELDTEPVLAPGPSSTWDRRGTRIAAVVDLDDRRVAYYDGRASAAENWEERTGVAVAGADGRFSPRDEGPVGTSPHATGSLRYVDVLRLPDGIRLYYEAARPDGAHDLLVENSPLPT